MASRRRPIATEAPLSAAVAVVLLAGWAAHPAEGDADHDGLFTLGIDRNEAALWRQHEAYLRAEAARRGIDPEWDVVGRPMFFGEFCAQPAAVQTAYWQSRTDAAAAAMDDDGNED